MVHVQLQRVAKLLMVGDDHNIPGKGVLISFRFNKK